MGVDINDRAVVQPALDKEAKTGSPAVAIQLVDGRIVTGKTGDFLGASSAALVNALKAFAGISHEEMILAPSAIAPIQELKTKYLGSKNPRLHTDEVLIALSATAADNEIAALALSQLPKLKRSQVHSSVILSNVDKNTFKKLECDVTYEAKTSS
jgi:uncharacterized protein (UPF0371 family)